MGISMKGYQLAGLGGERAVAAETQAKHSSEREVDSLLVAGESRLSETSTGLRGLETCAKRDRALPPTENPKPETLVSWNRFPLPSSPGPKLSHGGPGHGLQ
jgi:hypothetical protein